MDNPEQLNDKQMSELKEMKDAYISVFTSASGKKVLADLEKKCFVNRTTMPADGNTNHLAFREGMRYVAVHIKNMMSMDINRLKELATKGV